MLHAFEDERDAQVLKDALFVDGMDATIRDTRDDQFAIWVHDEDRMDEAQALLDELLNDPESPKFGTLQREAKAQRKKIHEKAKKSRHRVVKAREKIAEENRLGMVTMGLILFCVGIFVLAMSKEAIHDALVPTILARVGPGFMVVDLGASIGATFEAGPWRFFTPIFLHDGLLHLGFNMLFLFRLGAMVEKAHSGLRLVLMTFVFGTAGVLTELAWSGGAAVGMSGVIYGLFGYLWMRGRYDPTFQYGIDRSTVLWLMIWYVLCFAGFMNIANGAHTAGLVLGVIWGFLSSGYVKRKMLR